MRGRIGVASVAGDLTAGRPGATLAPAADTEGTITTSIRDGVDRHIVADRAGAESAELYSDVSADVQSVQQAS